MRVGHTGGLRVGGRSDLADQTSRHTRFGPYRVSAATRSSIATLRELGVGVRDDASVTDFSGPRRVSVVGNSGSGKTRLARTIAARLDVPCLELDAVFHLPGWTERPLEEFKGLVAQHTAGDGWVVDGNYGSVTSDLVWPRADTLVWLDLPRRVVMRQVIRRTLGRVATREELWNGNREPWSNLYRLDPKRSIIRWSWTQHTKYEGRFGTAMSDPALAHVTFVRLRSHGEAAAWVAQLPGH